jgi:hypothetical protein
MPKKKKLVGDDEDLKPIELPEEDDKVSPVSVEDDLGLPEEDLEDDEEEEVEEVEEF